MPEMKTIPLREIRKYFDKGTETMRLVEKMSQELLEADLNVQYVGLILNYVWYMVIGSGKLRPGPDGFGGFYII